MAHTVLVIEDEIHILELLRYNLEAAGYKVITSENGKEGLDKALEGKPDLVILDLMLPDVDGLEICKILKRMMKRKIYR
jgi:Response regulator containing CheY-like receiver, AAA-type ATPase, and DNA-binding domains